MKNSVNQNSQVVTMPIENGMLNVNHNIEPAVASKATNSSDDNSFLNKLSSSYSHRHRRPQYRRAYRTGLNY